MPLTIASNAMTDSGDYYVPTPVFSSYGAMRYISKTLVNGKNQYSTGDTTIVGDYNFCQYNSTSTRWQVFTKSSGEDPTLELESTSLGSSEPWTATWSGQTVTTNLSRGLDFIISSLLSSGYKGAQNTIINSRASSLTTGTENIILQGGTNTFPDIETGNSNVMVGSSAGNGITSGNQNTAVGMHAYQFNNYNNSSCLGANASVTASNQVQLGNSQTTTYVYGTIQDRSDERDKTEIKDTELGLEFVKALRPVDFKWDMREDYRPEAPSIVIKPADLKDDATEEEKAKYDQDLAAYNAYVVAKDKWLEDVKLANITHDGSKKRNRYHHGLIAQEVKAVLDEKGIDFGGFQDHKIAGGDDVLSIGYAELIAPMIKAIQELSAEVASLKAQLNP